MQEWVTIRNLSCTVRLWLGTTHSKRQCHRIYAEKKWKIMQETGKIDLHQIEREKVGLGLQVLMCSNIVQYLNFSDISICGSLQKPFASLPTRVVQFTLGETLKGLWKLHIESEPEVYTSIYPEIELHVVLFSCKQWKNTQVKILNKYSLPQHTTALYTNYKTIQQGWFVWKNVMSLSMDMTGIKCLCLQEQEVNICLILLSVQQILLCERCTYRSGAMYTSDIQLQLRRTEQYNMSKDIFWRG